MSRDPIGEEGGLNLYGFVYNSPVQWIDRLGLDPLPPRPLNRDDLINRSTIEEARLALNLSNKKGTQYEDELWKLVQRREERTMKVTLRKQKFGPCECGRVRVKRVESLHGGTDKSWIDGTKGGWVDLDESKNNALPTDPEQQFHLTIVGGTCSSYRIKLKVIPRKGGPKPIGFLPERMVATGFTVGEVNLQSHAIISSTDMRRSFIRPWGYESETGHANARVVIEIVGTKGGCSHCKKLFTIYE